MPKHIEDVVIPTKRKSIKDIPVPVRRHEAPPPPPPKKVKNRSGRRRGRWFVGVIVLLVAIIAVLSYFAGGTLSYVPKSADLNFEGDKITASKSGNGLIFSVVKFSQDKGVVVSATKEEEVKRKATGTIIIYNNGTAAQPLVATTRFETPDHKIYRLDKAVTVPAKSSVEVTVTADVPGETGNIGLADFTLPGLKGTPKFETIYGRSKAAMSGGFIGKAKIVDDTVLAEAKGELDKALRRELIEMAQAQAPEDFVIFPNLSVVTFDDLPQTGATEEQVTINRRGNINAVMFKHGDLARALGILKTEVLNGEEVIVDGLEGLELAFAGTPPADLISASLIDLTVTGSGRLVWRLDEEALKMELAGRTKRDIQAIVNNYPAIANAEVVLRPFWKTTFPQEGTAISIKALPIK